MGKREDYEERTAKLIEPVLKKFNLELYDVDYEKEGSDYYLRVYLTKGDCAVTIDDCQNVSRAFNEILDSEDYIKDPYIFEVSSLGITRPLKKDKDFDSSIGKAVDIKLFKEVDGLKEFTANLVAHNSDNKSIVVELDGNEHTIEKSNLSMCRLSYVWQEDPTKE